jgi:hypothetical protein
VKTKTWMTQGLVNWSKCGKLLHPLNIHIAHSTTDVDSSPTQHAESGDRKGHHEQQWIMGTTVGTVH